MKILLNYDKVNGAISTNDGLIIFNYIGLENHEHDGDNGKYIESLVTLKNAGFEVNEIIELNRKGLV